MEQSSIRKSYFKRHFSKRVCKYTDTLLYLAARNEHVKTKIGSFKNLLLYVIDLLTQPLLIRFLVRKFKFYNKYSQTNFRKFKPNITFVLKVSPKYKKKIN